MVEHHLGGSHEKATAWSSEPRPVSSVAQAVEAFQRDGLFVMHDVVSATDMKSLRSAAQDRFAEVVQALTDDLCECVRASSGSTQQQIKFAEVMGRDGGRFDSRYGMDSAPFASLLGRTGCCVSTQLVEALRAVLGNDAEVTGQGQVVAMSPKRWQESLRNRGDAPTFGPQKWHTDGPSAALPLGTPSNGLTLFIPTIDLTEQNGPTQFLLGSHRGDKAGVEWANVADGVRDAEATTLYLPARAAVAFDLRLWHRGLANNDETTNRHILYAIIGRPRWHDGMKLLPNLDVGRTSLFDPAGDQIEPAPSFRLGSLRRQDCTTATAVSRRVEHTESQASDDSERSRKKPRCMKTGMQ